LKIPKKNEAAGTTFRRIFLLERFGTLTQSIRPTPCMSSAKRWFIWSPLYIQWH